MLTMHHCWKLATVGLLLAATGCAQMGKGLSWRNTKEAELQHVAYEEEIPETPADPKDPNRLKLAYAHWMEESGRINEARTHYSDVKKAEPKNIDAILGLARVDLLSGRYNEAEQGFQRVIKLEPNSGRAHYELARCYESQKRWGDAVTELNKALLADPTDTSFRYQLAVALTESGDIEGALPHFGRVVGDAEAHYNVGLILKQQGQMAEAEKHFSIALAKKPELKEAEHWLNELHTRTSTGRVAEHSIVSSPPALASEHAL